MANKPIQRICCVCHVKQPTDTMTRVVRTNGSFVVQGQKRLNGRGAHICGACLSSPNLRKGLNRSFKTQLPDAIYKQLADTTNNAKLQ